MSGNSNSVPPNPVKDSLSVCDGDRRLNGRHHTEHSYNPFIMQNCTHMRILEVGSRLHQQDLEEFEREKQKCIQEAQAAVRAQAEIEKEQAVEEALQQAMIQTKKLIAKKEKKHEKEKQEAVLRVETEMQQRLQEELRKEREAMEQSLTKEMEQTLQRFTEESKQAIAEARKEALEQAAQAALAMEKEFIHQIEQANRLAQKNQAKAMEQLEHQKEQELAIAVTSARNDEQRKAQSQINMLETRHQAELENLQQVLRAKDAELQDSFQHLGIMTAYKDELDTELEETRQAFQLYINITFPRLGPGQANFLLPPRKTAKQ